MLCFRGTLPASGRLITKTINLIALAFLSMLLETGFRQFFYQPVWKKRVFIAGLQPGHAYTLTAHFINTTFPAFIGVRQERIGGFIETTPDPPQCRSIFRDLISQCTASIK